MQEIAHGAVLDAVVEIAQAAGKNEPDRNMRNAHPLPRPAHEQRDCRDRCHNREPNEQLATMLADAEHRAVIQHQGEVEQPKRQRLDATVVRQHERWIIKHALACEFDGVARHMGKRPRLRPQIERQSTGKHANKPKP